MSASPKDYVHAVRAVLAPRELPIGLMTALVHGPGLQALLAVRAIR